MKNTLFSEFSEIETPDPIKTDELVYRDTLFRITNTYLISNAIFYVCYVILMVHLQIKYWGQFACFSNLFMIIFFLSFTFKFGLYFHLRIEFGDTVINEEDS